MDAATFRTLYPEFASTSAYPDVVVTRWLGIAARRLTANRWADMLDDGIGLFTAHQLTMARRAALDVQKGSIPGTSAGVVSAKAVDKVSMSYDTGAATIDGAGFYNLSAYGTQFWQLARMIGIGGAQL